MSYWSAEECVALIFCKDPHQISVQDVEDFLPATSFAQNYVAVHEQILAAQRNKELPERILPVEFLAWAKDKIRVPDKLEKAVSANEIDIAQLEDRCKRLEQRHGELRRENRELRYELDRLRASNPPQPKEPKEPSTKERTSLYKLIIGMAMDAYGWDPKATRSPVPKQIADYLKEKELDLDHDTVLKYLREAKEVLP